MPNYAWKEPGDAIPNGSVIDNGNFSQLSPGTEILVGKTLTINGGNWVNVKQQPEWTVNGGNWSQKSFCSNLHPNMVALGLATCADNCAHVVDTDEVTIDGVLVGRTYQYEDTLI